MKNILADIQPFDKHQTLYVYEDHNRIETANPTIDDFNTVLFNLCNKYNITHIDLHGPKQYNRGLAKKILEAEMAKYDENKLEINIM